MKAGVLYRNPFTWLLYDVFYETMNGLFIVVSFMLILDTFNFLPRKYPLENFQGKTLVDGNPF